MSCATPAAPDRVPMRTYADGFATACETALAGAGPHVRDLQIGRATIRMRFAGTALLPLAHALRYQLRDPGACVPPATIELWDAASTGVLPPPFPVRDTRIPAPGEIRRDELTGTAVLVQSPVRARDGAYEAMTILDPASATARCFVTMPERIPPYELAAPLRAVLQWALNGPERLLAHAAAVGVGARGVLLAGRAGSGKSTTAIAALLGGLRYVGDDYVFVELSGSVPVAHSVYATAKLGAEALATVRPARSMLTVRPSGQAAKKYVLDVAGAGEDALARRLELAAILLPRVEAGEPSRLEPASAGAALLALAPTSALHPPQRDASELGPLAVLARALQAHRLVLGGDPADAVGLIRALLERT